MKNTLNNCIILIILASIVFSCNDEKQEPKKLFDSYKIEIGTKWKYKRLMIVKNFVPLGSSTVDANYTDTLVEDFVVVSVDKKVVINGIETTLITSTLKSNANLFTDYQFYTNDSSGLKSIAYCGTGLIASPKKGLSKHFEYLNSSLLGFYDSNQQHSITDDTLFYDKPPVTIFEYPMRINTQWFFRSNGISSLDKKIVGIVDLKTKIGDYKCYKIEYIPDPKSNFKAYEYVSEFAILKRESTQIKTVITDIYGKQIGSGDAIELYEIEEISLPKK